MNKKNLFAISILFLAIALSVWGAQVIGYSDWSLMSAPGSPSSGFLRLYSDSSSGAVKCKNSAGAACFFSSSGGVSLQTNGTPNGSQALLNLAAGTGMTLTDNGTGTVTFASSGSGITLQTNGVNNGSQSTLNLHAGTNMTLTDNGSGQVTLDAAASGSTGHAIGMAFGVAGGTPLATSQIQYVTVPFACTIAGWNLTVDAGTATVDVWKLAAGPADWSGLSGTVNTSGTGVTWVSGSTFPADSAGRAITINSVLYEIATRTSSTALVLATSAGTQTGVSYASPGTAIPTVTNKIDGSSLPAISSGTFAGSTNLSGWTSGNTGLHVIKNDVFGFNINAVSSATALSIVLECN